MLYELKKTMHEQNRNINKDIEIIKRTKKKYWSWRITILELKCSLEEIDSRFIEEKNELVELKIGHFKLCNQKNKEKKSKKWVMKTQGACGTWSDGSIYALWETQKGKREKGTETIFKEIMTKNFSILGKNIDT